MIKISITTLGILLASVLFGQMHNGKFGNEWINHSQSYYKIKIIKEGLYRIDKNILTRDIPDFSQIQSNQLQLFYMGEQVPVYVHLQNGVVEYIEFFGESNNGQFDVNLYRKAEHHFNPDYSLITDTASYFLTWSSSQTNQQYQNQISNFNNLPSKELFYTYTSKEVLSTNWNRGMYHLLGGASLSKGFFDYGEGYGGSFSQSQNITISTPSVSTASSNATIQIRGYACGYADHKLQVTTGSSVQTFQQFHADSVYSINTNIPVSSLNSNSTLVNITGLSGGNDLHSLSTVSISYPRSFDFNGESSFRFDIGSSNQSKYLEISNFNGGSVSSQQVFLYDISNRQRIQCYWDGTLVKAVLPASSSKRQLVLSNEMFTETVHRLYPTHFVNYNIARGDYVVISHPDLFQDSEGRNPVFDYCAYRTTTGEKPSIHSVLELYDQFSYGIAGHPLAIKNFAAFIKQNWQSIKPKNIFLIGKGRIYNTVRQNAASNNLIPTFGYPPSDNLLISPIDSDVPVLPVGRLAATSGDDVSIYLEKIKQMESGITNTYDYENQHWRKQIMHLGGGTNGGEQHLFKYYLSTFKNRVDLGLSGKKVHSFSKENTEYTSIPNSEKIDSLINSGVSLISFFGHGSTTNFDYYLNTPDYYNNKNKYPLIIAMGCHNGTIYEDNRLMSENFLFKKDGGASSYISFVNSVFANCAYIIGDKFYTYSNNNMYNSGIGAILKQTLEDLSNSQSYTDIYQLAANYLVLHGDPALKINYRNSPDYYISNSTISTNPQNITNTLSNFKLLVEVHNWGQYKDTIIRLKVIRTHPSGEKDTSYISVDAPKDKLQVELIVPINGYEDLGINKFSIFADDNNKINELPDPEAESNNIVVDFPVQVGNSMSTAVYPKDFAIVGSSTVTLKASTTNAFENNQNWAMEIDTTNKFNSPLLMKTSSPSTENFIEWTPNIALKDQQVYYWRVKSTANQQQSSDWAESSFMYSAHAADEGWNQSHVYQFQKNSFERMYVGEDQNEPFNFSPSSYEISVKSGFVPNALDASDLALFQNGSKVDKCRCPQKNGVYVAVLDPTTLNFWTLPGFSSQYGAINCDAAGRIAYSYLFETNSSIGQQNLSDFILNTIPAEHVVIIYTLNNGFGSGWKSGLVGYLKSMGATKIDSFITSTTSKPYAISFRKNIHSPQLSEELGIAVQNSIYLNNTAGKIWHEGKIISPLIGPAKSWRKMEWSVSSVEPAQPDSASVDIWGINQNGEKELLFNNIKNSNFNLSSVDATIYPYLQLVLNNEDIQNKTPAQLDYWRVWGDLSEDIALTISSDYKTIFDSIQTPLNIEVDFTISNLGHQDINNAQLEIYIVGADTLSYTIPSVTKMNSTSVSVNIPTKDLLGHQHLVARLVPLKNERIVSNNWGWMDFVAVEGDVNTSQIITEASDNGINNIRNYPNPFSSQTKIEFDLEGVLPEQVSIEIYDLKGSLIQHNIQDAEQKNHFSWNGSGYNGMDLPSGMYYCKISSMFSDTEMNKNSKPQILKIIKQ